MVWLAVFNSAVRLFDCKEIRLSSRETSAFKVDSMLLLDFKASDRMPLVELVPPLVSMVLKFWPQLFAFWKKPTTPLKSEFKTESMLAASKVIEPLLFTVMPRLVRLLMSDELVKWSAAALVLVVSRMLEVTEIFPALPAVPDVSRRCDPLLSVTTEAFTPTLALLMTLARPARLLLGEVVEFAGTAMVCV